MKNKIAVLFCCALLTACAASAPPPLPPMPEPVAEPVPIIAVLRPSSAPSELDGLLAYSQSVRELSPAELAKELANLHQQPKCAQVSLQKALVLALLHNSADLARAQVQIDGVLKSTEPDALALKPFAQFLLAGNAELRRLNEQADKLAQQNKDAQRRIDQLNETLEALKAIERSLPARPNGSMTGPAK